MAATHLTGAFSMGFTSNSLEDFKILKAFNVDGKVDKAPKIITVYWIPPYCNWIKCNTDGSARGSPGHAACGGIFRGFRGEIVGCFSYYIGVTSALHAELEAAMIAIEVAFQRGWMRLWLECDSQLVVQAFNSEGIVPWKLRNRWKNCKILASKMNFIISHVYREGNTCVDKLANFGVDNHGFNWWYLPPSFIRQEFSINKLGMPKY